MGKFWKQEDHNHHFPELNKKRLVINWLKGFLTPSKLTVIMIVLTVLTGFTYLTQTNSVATKGYEIKDLDDKVTVLREQNRELYLQYIELQSMAKVIEEAQNLNLVASTDVDVITPLGSTVALR